MTATVSVAHYRRLTDTAARVRDLSWEQLADALSLFEERSSKDGPLWSPVSFKTGTPKTRKNEHIAAVTAFTVDYDHQEPPWSLLDGLAYIAHTTFTHHAADPKCDRPDCPHWRLVVRLAEPIPADDYAEAWTRLTFRLAPDADPSCKDVSRASYRPACRPGAAREIRRGEGRPIDWTTLRPVPPPPSVETVPPIRAATRPGTPNDGERPGDRFNRETSWADLLEPLGARCVSRLADGTERWQRPGKQDGISATADGAGSQVLYMFSSSWAPFEPRESYTRFRAYTLVEHGGDERAATRALAERYGMERPPDDGIVWANRDGDTWTGEPETVVAAIADEEDLAAMLAAARARIAELEAKVATGSDGAEGCLTCQQREADDREQRAWELMRKRGGWAPNPAAIIRSYAQVAEAAIAQGRASRALSCDDTSRITGVSKPGITRAHHYLDALQRDPEIGPTLPFHIYRPEKPGDYHRPWWVAVNCDETGQPIARTTAAMAAIFAGISLPKLNPNTQGDGRHGGARWRCSRVQHAQYGVIETVRRFFRCAAPGCSEHWEAETEVISHGVPDQEELHDETGPEDVQEALPFAADDASDSSQFHDETGPDDEVEIGGDRYAVAVQGEDAGDQFHDETGSFHGDAPEYLIRRRHHETGPLIPVSMVSREDMEAAAGPRYWGELPPDESEPPPPPPPLPLAPRSHIARAFLPRAIAGGDE